MDLKNKLLENNVIYTPQKKTEIELSNKKKSADIHRNIQTISPTPNFFSSKTNSKNVKNYDKSIEDKKAKNDFTLNNENNEIIEVKNGFNMSLQKDTEKSEREESKINQSHYLGNKNEINLKGIYPAKQNTIQEGRIYMLEEEEENKSFVSYFHETFSNIQSEFNSKEAIEGNEIEKKQNRENYYSDKPSILPKSESKNKKYPENAGKLKECSKECSQNLLTYIADKQKNFKEDQMKINNNKIEGKVIDLQIEISNSYHTGMNENQQDFQKLLNNGSKTVNRPGHITNVKEVKQKDNKEDIIFQKPYSTHDGFQNSPKSFNEDERENLRKQLKVG